MDKLDLTFVEKCVEQIGTGREKVLEIAQSIQEHFGYLPKEALERVCELTEISPASMVGVTTFYNRFRHRPAGKYIIRICVGTACHVKGADLVYDAFKRYLDIADNEDTDDQRLFTLEKVACLGCCTLAPAVQIEQVTYGHLTADTVSTVIKDFLRYSEISGAKSKRDKESKTDRQGYGVEPPARKGVPYVRPRALQDHMGVVFHNRGAFRRIHKREGTQRIQVEDSSC